MLAVSVRRAAYRARAQLRNRRCFGALQVDARFQCPASHGLGRVRIARRNAAIANKRPPREWTLSNIAKMKATHRRFQFSYDWDREVTTCEPDYYRWNQWFFLKMLERGIAYRKKALVNWCPQCATVLANEQVVNDGCCWRHETTRVEQRALEQWFFKITQYADELLADMAQLEGRLAGARAHHAAQLDRPV